MPFSIQTKHASKGFLQGDVVAIRPDGFQYFEGDCLKKWLEAGRSAESYTFNFAITYCSNPEMNGSEPEVQALVEEYEKGNPDALYKRRRYLGIPEDYNNINRVDLRNTGETIADWETIKQYIVERL